MESRSPDLLFLYPAAAVTILFFIFASLKEKEMCIYTNNENPLKAEERIPCVKIVRKYTYKNGSTAYIPLYESDSKVRYVIGEKAEMEMKNAFMSLLIREDNVEHFAPFIEKYQRYQDTGLHTFKPDCDAWKKNAQWAVDSVAHFYMANPSIDSQFRYNNAVKLEIAVLECCIPAGAKYIEGEHFCSKDIPDEFGYCSDCLEVIREMDNDWMTWKPEKETEE